METFIKIITLDTVLNVYLGHEHTYNTFLFILYLQYNDYVHFIEPCFKGILVQADRDNREVSTRLLLMCPVCSLNVIRMWS